MKNLAGQAECDVRPATRAMKFDPYHKWLGIPRDQRPPTFYQLLGVSRDEADTEVIEEAALMRIAHLRNYQLGPHAQECTKLLRELGEAQETLCDPEKRAAYDASLLPKVSAESHRGRETISPTNIDPPPIPPQEVIPEHRQFDPQPTPGATEPPAAPVAGAPGSPRTFSQSRTPEPVSGTRPEDKFLQELSYQALSQLRQPIEPEQETLWQLMRQLFREWREQLAPWWPSILRRTAALVVLVVLSVLGFYLVDWLF